MKVSRARALSTAPSREDRRRVVRGQQALFESLWHPARGRSTPSQVMTGIGRQLGVLSDLPNCVLEDRPPVDGRELGAVVAQINRVELLRKAYLTTLGFMFMLDVVGTQLAGDFRGARSALLRGADHSPEYADEPLGWPYKPVNQYWHPPRINQPFEDPDYHHLAEHMIPWSLYRARDRVLRRVETSPGGRQFLEEYLPALQHQYVTMREWRSHYTSWTGPQAPPMRTLMESLSGVVAENTASVIRGVDTWISASLVRLPTQLSAADQERLHRALPTPQSFADNLLHNYEPLFVAPASLPFGVSMDLIDSEHGSAVWKGSERVVARLQRDPERGRDSVNAFWETRPGEPDMLQALRHGSKCGGLNSFSGCDRRSSAIILEARARLPPGADLPLTRMTPIGLSAVLAAYSIRNMWDRLRQVAPWMSPTHLDGPLDRFVESTEVPPARIAKGWPERVHVPLLDFPCLTLRLWSGQEMDRWGRAFAESYSHGWWHPPQFRWLERDGIPRERKPIQEALRILQQAAPFKQFNHGFTYALMDGARPLGQIRMTRPRKSRSVWVARVWMLPFVSHAEMERAWRWIAGHALVDLGASAVEVGVPLQEDRLPVRGNYRPRSPYCPEPGWNWAEFRTAPTSWQGPDHLVGLDLADIFNLRRVLGRDRVPLRGVG